MDDELIKKLKFIEFLDNFKYVKRQIFQPKSLDEFEDDAQHSWHLAMFAFILLDEYPDLNREKCLSFALIHDLPEIIVGDVGAYDKKARIGKKERENDAMKKLVEMLPSKSAQNLSELYLEYDNQHTKEARFIYQLDKILPMILNILNNGKTWNFIKLDSKTLLENKLKKVDDEFNLRKIVFYYYNKAIDNNFLINK